jgi:hypothetical protein
MTSRNHCKYLSCGVSTDLPFVLPPAGRRFLFERDDESMLAGDITLAGPNAASVLNSSSIS